MIQTVPWDLFVTLTFRERGVSYPVARARMLLWLEELPKSLAPCECAWVVERQRDGTAHVHALWRLGSGASSPSSVWRRLKERWFSLWGIARFTPYIPGRGAADYLCKYLTKGIGPWGIAERKS